MNKKSIPFQTVAYLFIVIVLGFILLEKGKFILGPLAFSVLFTVMLQPVCDFFERLVKYKIPAFCSPS